MTASIPMPPLELRRWAGPTAPEDFDNPGGIPVYEVYGIAPDAYDTVFDFGCGCGRVARQLLQQRRQPRRYVGVDPHRGLIDWCQQNLSPVNPSFQFLHHDVYSPGYAPGNSLRLAEPFPVADGQVSLFIASSVFTHLCRQQAEYYLREVARVLKPGGMALTSWLLFDRASFPFLPEPPVCLFTSEADFSQGVIYDRGWFIEAVRRLGLGVQSTTPPAVPGHQWVTVLVRRTPGMVDQFPLGEEGAERLCGATLKAIAPACLGASAKGADATAVMKSHRVLNPSQKTSARPQPPDLFGELAVIEAMRRSWSWRVGRAVTSPARALKKVWGPASTEVG